MPQEPEAPLAVSFSRFLVRIAAVLVPAAQREDWQREWLAEIWHRWQFLFHTGEWNRREQLLLIRNSFGSIWDAAWMLASQESVQARASELARSPFTFLGFLAACLLLIALTSGGLPATRGLIGDSVNRNAEGLTFIYQHHYLGGGDRGLPPDIVPAWASHSDLLKGVAGLDARHQNVTLPGGSTQNILVVQTNPALFDLLEAKPQLGQVPGRESGLVLSHGAWMLLAHADRGLLGKSFTISKRALPVMAVLPNGFHFLSRQPTIYLVDPLPTASKVFVVTRVKHGVSEQKLDKELTKIAEDVAYYYNMRGQFRYSSWRDELLTPLQMFATATLISSIIALISFWPRWRRVKAAWDPLHRKAAAKRAGFFCAKLALALACVFVGCLEWSRSESSVLLASRDPGTGPFLIWLYVLGTMGVLFWCVADQRARCRVCLRLMAFPVRIGCPGCLLLDWSGTELFCSEGHGLLHVPHMAPSWDEEADRWVALDDSWKGLFAQQK